MWFRKEQLQTVTWAGDPSKPVVGNDPMELSPRRSFAAWSEIVRGTALPWSSAELALARAIGAALIDIIVQVNAVRLLIAEHQLTQLRSTVLTSNEPVVIANPAGRLLFSNDAFYRLAGRTHVELQSLQGLAGVFDDIANVRELLARLLDERNSWRGELVLRAGGSRLVPVQLRAEVVPGRDGSVLGYMLTLADLTDRKRTAAARLQLEQSLSNALDTTGERTPDKVIGAIMANASLAAMDIADAGVGPEMAPLARGSRGLGTARRGALHPDSCQRPLRRRCQRGHRARCCVAKLFEELDVVAKREPGFVHQPQLFCGRQRERVKRRTQPRRQHLGRFREPIERLSRVFGKSERRCNHAADDLPAAQVAEVANIGVRNQCARIGLRHFVEPLDVARHRRLQRDLPLPTRAVQRFKIACERRTSSEHRKRDQRNRRVCGVPCQVGFQRPIQRMQVAQQGAVTATGDTATQQLAHDPGTLGVSVQRDGAFPQRCRQRQVRRRVGRRETEHEQVPKFGAPGGTRTHDPWLRRPVLYPLSYRRVPVVRSRASFSAEWDAQG